MWLLTALLPAIASDAGVLVADFRSRDAGADELAALLSEAVASELATIEGVEVVPLDQVGPVHDTPVWMYLASCPRDEEAGCAFVVAELAAARYAVAGSVSSKGEGARVDASIVDVLASEEIVHLEIDLAAGDEAGFAERVAEVLSRVLRGEIGREGDVRGLPSAAERARIAAEREALFRELASDLDRELSGVSLEPRASRRVSPLGLAEWRARARGRAGQVLLRPFVGYVRGPIDAEYYGRFAREASGGAFVVAESYAYQSTLAGSGPVVGVEVAYGLLPWLELGVEGGLAYGRYGVDIGVQSVGEPPPATRPEEFANRSLLVGPTALVVPFPVWAVRPLVGASVLWWSGTTVDDHAEPPDETGSFPRRSTWTLGVVAGAEARVSRTVDLYLHAPLGLAIAGEADIRHEGSDALGDLPSPPPLDPFVAGVVVGIQVRIKP
jgi:hypothetical protein